MVILFIFLLLTTSENLCNFQKYLKHLSSIVKKQHAELMSAYKKAHCIDQEDHKISRQGIRILFAVCAVGVHFQLLTCDSHT